MGAAASISVDFTDKSAAEVAAILAQADESLGGYSQNFIDGNVDGAVVLSLVSKSGDEIVEYLTSIGITDAGHQDTIKNFIAYVASSGSAPVEEGKAAEEAPVEEGKAAEEAPAEVVDAPTDAQVAAKFSLSESMVAEMRESFAQIDTSGNGKIDREELKSMLLKVASDCATEDIINEMMAIADTNGDGGVDFEEFIKAATA
jgi:hypothetical protein